MASHTVLNIDSLVRKRGKKSLCREGPQTVNPLDKQTIRWRQHCNVGGVWSATIDSIDYWMEKA
jgi:hypothetical protein